MKMVQCSIKHNLFHIDLHQGLWAYWQLQALRRRLWVLMFVAIRWCAVVYLEI